MVFWSGAMRGCSQLRIAFMRSHFEFSIEVRMAGTNSISSTVE